MKEFLFVALFEKLYLKLPTTLKSAIPLILTLLATLFTSQHEHITEMRRNNRCLEGANKSAECNYFLITEN